MDDFYVQNKDKGQLSTSLASGELESQIEDVRVLHFHGIKMYLERNMHNSHSRNLNWVIQDALKEERSGGGKRKRELQLHFGTLSQIPMFS